MMKALFGSMLALGATALDGLPPPPPSAPPPPPDDLDPRPFPRLRAPGEYRGPRKRGDGHDAERLEAARAKRAQGGQAPRHGGPVTDETVRADVDVLDALAVTVALTDKGRAWVLPRMKALAELHGLTVRLEYRPEGAVGEGWVLRVGTAVDYVDSFQDVADLLSSWEQVEPPPRRPDAP